MSPSWQTIAAISIVGVTIALFIVRAVRKKNKPGCGSDCGCAPARNRTELVKLIEKTRR